MTAELVVLALTAILQMAHVALLAILGNLELGASKTLAPRDKGPITEMLSTRNARLARAFDNHTENLVLFAVAVTVLTLAEKSSGLTVACAWIYLAARLAYVPAYVFGFVPWRSLIWTVGYGATAVILGMALI